MITLTEFCALDMEYNHKENEAEKPNVSNILQKNLNLKIRNNLTKDEKMHEVKRITKR